MNDVIHRLFSKWRPTRATALVVGAVVAAALTLTVATPRTAQAADPIRVMVYNGAYTSLPVFVAKDQGLYAKHDLDATLTVVNSGPAGVAALLGGSLDFVEVPTDQVIENHIRGTDLKIVVGNEGRNFYDVIAQTKVKLPHLAEGYPAVMHDFKGLRIGVNALGASTHLMMNALLLGAGMRLDDVTYVADGSSTTELAAWQAGRVDAQMAFTPFPEIVSALGSGRSVIDFSRGQGPDVLQKIGGAFEDFSTKGSYIAAHPDLVRHFIAAQQEAIAWMKDKANRQKLIEEVNKHVDVAIIPPAKRNETVALMIDNYSRYLDPHVDRGAIEAWNQYLLENKLIPHAVPASAVIWKGAP